MPPSPVIHSQPLPGGDFTLYTSGMHPGPELYTVAPHELAAVACDVIHLLAAQSEVAPLAEGDCIVVGNVIVGVTEPSELPADMVRCSRDARCLRLLFFNKVTPPPSPPPPEMRPCPVCFEPDAVCDRPPHPAAAFAEATPGAVLWCGNGHGTCVSCVRRCELRRRGERLCFKCPLCRAVTALGAADHDVLLAGSWHGARNL